ncbi:MAG: 50S ribosomal protein L6 [Candidatus Portnoybacteria bacterium]
MSRIGRKPIELPENVEAAIDGREIRIKGPKGELIQTIPSEIEVLSEDRKLMVKVKRKTKNSAALWGLLRSLIFNMAEGVSRGYEKKLEINGVGYRANLEGNKLVMSLGFSHPVELEAPSGIEFNVEKNIIIVSGIDKQQVGQVAAKIRSFKKPEPYKGKGIKYIDEVIRRKSGKKTVGAE